MEFNQPKGIFQQIADQICDRILEGEWSPGDRIPSIRELAVNIGVNPNTVTRSYQLLMDREVVANQRGIGYFVSADARKNILNTRKAEFFHESLPRLFRTMELLSIEMDELAQHFVSYEGEKNQ